MKVSLVKREVPGLAVREAVESCDGLEDLDPGSRVLIKPNMCTSSHKKTFPPFGRNATAAVVEELVIMLREHGCRDITIGEGTVVHEELGASFKQAVSFSGIDRVARTHKLRVVDFDEGPSESVELEGHRIQIAREALEADFLINVPVLKAHMQTVVSLGMKNMKGALSTSSKRRFHMVGLETMIAALNVRVPCDLTVIDGIYSLDRGGPVGPAHRRDLVIASRDVLAADIVGTMVLGKKPSEIVHLTEYAGMTGRSLDLDSIELLGEAIESVAEESEYEMSEELKLEKFGVRGTWGEPLAATCSGCSMALVVMVVYTKDNPGIRRWDVEVCVGPGAIAHPESETILLLGDCAIKSNKDVDGAIKVKGCPPSMFDYMKLLYKNTLSTRRANALLLKRTAMALLAKAGIYHEWLGIWDSERSPEFDMGHFE